jgi:hypothetical protein
MRATHVWLPFRPHPAWDAHDLIRYWCSRTHAYELIVFVREHQEADVGSAWKIRRTFLVVHVRCPTKPSMQELNLDIGEAWKKILNTPSC